MGYRIGLEGYEVQATHGWFDHELTAPQPFIVNAEVHTEGERADDLPSTVNYAELQHIVDEVLLTPGVQHRLMESMVDAMLDRMVALPGVVHATVRIAKPDAPLPHPGGVPWVEASRSA